MLKIHTLEDQSVHFYLLDNDRHKLLIDCGFPGSMHAAGRLTRTLGFKLSEIDFLIHTHFHVDHAGAAQEYKNLGVKCILLENQVDALHKMEIMCSQKWKYLKMQKEDNLLMSSKKAEAFLQSYQFNLQILSTPSHSEDSYCFITENGEIFSGDLMQFNLIFDESSPQKKDWDLIVQKGGKHVFPGHGSDYFI